MRRIFAWIICVSNLRPSVRVIAKLIVSHRITSSRLRFFVTANDWKVVEQLNRLTFWTNVINVYSNCSVVFNFFCSFSNWINLILELRGMISMFCSVSLLGTLCKTIICHIWNELMRFVVFVHVCIDQVRGTNSIQFRLLLLVCEMGSWNSIKR